MADVPMVEWTDDAVVWRCDVCAEPITPGAGHVSVSHEALGDYATEREAWRDVHPEGTGISLRDLNEHPERVVWRAVHTACDPDENVYAIPVDRLATLPAVMAWTAHLMGKQWFDDTNWKSILRRVATAANGGVAPRLA